MTDKGEGSRSLGSIPHSRSDTGTWRKMEEDEVEKAQPQHSSESVLAGAWTVAPGGFLRQADMAPRQRTLRAQDPRERCGVLGENSGPVRRAAHLGAASQHHFLQQALEVMAVLLHGPVPGPEAETRSQAQRPVGRSRNRPRGLWATVKAAHLDGRTQSCVLERAMMCCLRQNSQKRRF